MGDILALAGKGKTPLRKARKEKEDETRVIGGEKKKRIGLPVTTGKKGRILRRCYR